MKLNKQHRTFEGWTQYYEHESPETKTSMKFGLFRPDSKPRGALIWLSGLTANEENFLIKAGAQRVLSELGIAVVCPDTSPRGLDLPGEHESYDFGSGAGFYLDATVDPYSNHYRMASYLLKDLYPMIDQELGLGGKISITGHSMGGHGALTLGLKNPELFKSVSAFSPICNPVECDWGKKAFAGYLGEDKNAWRDHDTCELLISGKSHSWPILIDQGLNDEFYPHQLMTENLQKVSSDTAQKVDIRFRKDYDHSYFFISSFIEEHIRFHSEAF